MEIVTSRDNAQIKRIVKLLGHKKERDETGLFVTEGVRLSLEAQDCGLSLEAACMTESALQKAPALRRLEQSGAPVFFIGQELALRISDTRTPQGVFCIWRQKNHGEDTIRMGKNGRCLLLCSLQDPGNLGTILRTAEAFGLDGVFLSDDCPDIYSPKVLRATMGGVFRQPIAVCGDIPGLIGRLGGQGVTLYASALHRQAIPLRQAGFQGPCGLLVGNEGAGLPSGLVDLCQYQVLIPMTGGAESLNAAVATGILLWEMCARQPGH